MRNRVCSILLFFVFLLNGASAFAWNNIGHMSVAYIAWNKLTPASGTRVTALIRLNPFYPKWVAILPDSVSPADRDMYLFMIAATWPDQIKSDGKDFTCNGVANTNDPPADEAATLNIGYGDTCMHKYWHFLDIRYAPDGTTPVPVAVPVPNAEQKIDAFALAVHSTEPDALKSYDLVWLEHLIGDIHQPLHTVTRFSADHPTGDAGGNLVTIAGPQKELHAYWDDILGDRTASLYTDALLAKQIASALPKAPKTAAADVATADWVAESVKHAEADVYLNPPIGPEWGPYTTTDAYEANALAVAQVRIELAGARLAKVIRTDLK